jgi:hypothetical protein
MYITGQPFYRKPDDTLISTGNTNFAAMKSLLVICNYKALDDLTDRGSVIVLIAITKVGL